MSCDVTSRLKWTEGQRVHNSAHQSSLRRFRNMLKNEMFTPGNVLYIYNLYIRKVLSPSYSTRHFQCLQVVAGFLP